MDNEKIKDISLKGSSKRSFLLFHGYTGSPRDFDNLPELLNKKFNADVKVIRLLGHGTKVEDLLNYRYDDYKQQIEKEIKKELNKRKEVFIGGFSFGGLLALYLASKYDVKGVFTICPPIKLKFPFNLTILSYVRFLKAIFNKSLSEKEKKEMEFTFYYDKMPSVALKICQDASRETLKNLNKINCPVLSIFSGKDDITNKNASKKIEKRIIPANLKNLIYEDATHRPASKKFREIMKREIILFLEDYCFNNKNNRKKVSAIIPAYNEEKGIGEVIRQIKKIPLINEIIVVDDGSTDQTAKIVKNFKDVRLIKNKVNMGKASSMDIGVKSTSSEVIFFCDADLRGLNPKELEKIIIPVVNGNFDMYLGLRRNKMQQAIKLFALNTGERALKRELWEKLPDFYKHRYRIEAGINYYAKHYGKGFGYVNLSYFQTLKEAKYGFFKGTYLRWRMNFDVLLAYIRAYLFDLPIRSLFRRK